MAIRLGISSRLAYSLMDTESGYHNPQRLADITGLTPSELQKALRMAENKVLKWVVSQFVRNLQGQLADSERVRITQSALKSRIRVSNAMGNGNAARMWMGIYNMNLRRFGVGMESGQGYTVGKRYEQGGFRAQMHSGHEGIFRRLTSQRLPILELGVPIKKHAWTAVEDIMTEAEDRLKRELKQAIKYLISKKLGIA